MHVRIVIVQSFDDPIGGWCVCQIAVSLALINLLADRFQTYLKRCFSFCS